ncbi:pilin [Pseudomonas aeruginosa]|uniref:pilin n=1 Tax=Pseudomonas aeruginosa TaxID=287 RepID=UPI001EDF50CD
MEGRLLIHRGFTGHACRPHEKSGLDGSGKSQIQVTDNKDGTVELVATLGKSSGSAIKGAVITVSRKNDGVWNCKITKTPTAWKPNYAPANCPKS